jgi:uncharacterized protein affecting Mg2+/Co2+ transport
MYCPNCGYNNRANVNFCEQCGTALRAAAQQPPMQAPPPAAAPQPVVVSVGERRHGIDLGWAAVMLVLMMLCVGALMLFEVVKAPDFAEAPLERIRDNLASIFGGEVIGLPFFPNEEDKTPGKTTGDDGGSQGKTTGGDGGNQNVQGNQEEEDEDGGAAAEDDCNVAKFVRETIPDHTIFAPGQKFTKTWTVRNEGTCTWNTGYRLFFTQGMGMGGEETIPVTRSVPPGDTYTFECHMTAPSSPGSYLGRWDMFDDQGNRFSWVTVLIDVATPEQPKPACNSELDFDACIAAGGRWTEGLVKYWCLCP